MNSPQLDIKLLAMDVDGVLTDGGIIVHDDGSESKRFHVHDGAWIRVWQRRGLKTAIITGRQCQAVAHRMTDLEIDYVYQQAHRKIEAFAQLLSTAQLQPHQIAYIGDDVMDLPVMRQVGYSGAPADAFAEVRAAADYVTQKVGGYGAAGEFICHLLQAMGLFDKAMEPYRE